MFGIKPVVILVAFAFSALFQLQSAVAQNPPRILDNVNVNGGFVVNTNGVNSGDWYINVYCSYTGEFYPWAVHQFTDRDDLRYWGEIGTNAQGLLGDADGKWFTIEVVYLGRPVDSVEVWVSRE